MGQLPEMVGGKGFTLRAVIIASLMTIFLLASSSYIALKIGALPWPIIFSVVACGGLLGTLSIFRKTDVHEINVAQAGSSIGGLMASAIVFVIPGIWFLQKQGIIIDDISTGNLIVACILGGLLGVLLSIPLRRVFIDKEKLAYPSGAAGAETLLTFKKSRTGLLLLMLAGALAGIFALSRDLYFAAGFSFSLLTGITIAVYPMPLAVGVGYILGKKNAFSWFGGAVIGWIAILPFLVRKGMENGNAITMIQNIGIGLVLGSGVGFLIIYIFPKTKEIFSPLFDFSGSPWYFKLTPVLSILAVFTLAYVGVPVLASIIAVSGVWLVTAIAARMTGETNIDPLEQFGIIIGMICILAYAAIGMKLSYESAFFIVCFVSVAAAIAGDIGHDYKSAKIIRTRPYDIIRIDLITVIIAGIFGPFILEIIRKGFVDVMFTAAMPAPQAQMVAGSISGFAYPGAFLAGFGIALILEIIFRKKKFVAVMPFGIGLFLGMGLGTMLLLGGIIAFFTKDKNKHNMLIAAAGLMGGEGIAGFVAAALFVFGVMSYAAAAKMLLIIFSILLIITFIFYIRRK